MENLAINETAKERQLRERAERDYASLNAIGLYTGETFYPPGTEAVAGRTAIKRARAEFEENPPATEALEALATAVQAENRVDVRATFGEMVMAPDPLNPLPTATLTVGSMGGFSLTGRERTNLVPTDRAVSQMQTKRPAGHPATAWDVNNWVRDVIPHEVVCRTRSMPANRTEIGQMDSREVFAIVSPDYIPYDIDAAANDLIAACPQDSRARIRYDGARCRVDIIIQNPYRFDGGDAAAVGETHRLVLRMTTADDGSAGYHLSLLAERVRCINLTLLHTKKSLFKATHRTDNLRNLAQDAIEKGGELMTEFGKVWSNSWQEYYADKHSKANISGDEAIKRIVMGDKYRIVGHSEAGTLAAVLTAWNEEPGDSKAHVHSALTRAAHTAPTSWGSRWCDDEAEVQASQLLYQRVSWLPEVDVS